MVKVQITIAIAFLQGQALGTLHREAVGRAACALSVELEAAAKAPETPREDRGVCLSLVRLLDEVAADAIAAKLSV
jgi:hypothetical protein